MITMIDSALLWVFLAKAGGGGHVKMVQGQGQQGRDNPCYPARHAATTTTTVPPYDATIVSREGPFLHVDGGSWEVGKLGERGRRYLVR